jgi:hypothetical protein
MLAQTQLAASYIGTLININGKILVFGIHFLFFDVYDIIFEMTVYLSKLGNHCLFKNQIEYVY